MIGDFLHADRMVIFDGRKLYDPHDVRNAGIEYHSVDRYVAECA